MIRSLLRITVPAIVFVSAPADGSAQQAQPPAAPSGGPAYPTVSVGVLSYLQYDAELQHREDYNAFDVTRGYINIVGDIAKNVRFRITPDVRRITDGSLAGSLTFRMKYAFAEFDNVLGDGSWVRFGLHQTPWLDFEESINRYRVQGQMFAEREGLIPGSGDFGAGLLTPLPGGYGEINAGVYNGEGFGEAPRHRDGQLRAPAPRRHGAVARRHRAPGVARHRRAPARSLRVRRAAAGSRRLGRSGAR
jgi:hypothetical protein